MTLDELLLEWSYRSERGYPTLDNPSDISTLKQILKELNLSEIEIEDVMDNLPDDKPGGDDLTNPGTDGMEDSEVEKEKEKQLKSKPKPKPEPEPEIEPETGTLTEYDELIRDTFGGKIPKSKNSYNFSKNTFDEQVKADDLEVWKKLWTLKPKKKTGDKTETLGVGKGELSLYWLYNHSNSNVITR